MGGGASYRRAVRSFEIRCRAIALAECTWRRASRCGVDQRRNDGVPRADVDAVGALASGDDRTHRTQPIANAGTALFVLLVTTVRSIYRPRGVTPYRQRT